MKAHIQTGISQKASLSQGMQLNLQLITMPTLALRELLLQAAQDNPFLELDEFDHLEAWQHPVTAHIRETLVFERNDGIDDEWITQIKSPESLRDTLIWQSGFVRWNSEEELIAQHIIDSIDEAGYLTASLYELFTNYGHDESQSLLVDSVLHRIQHFEPAGVGARDIQECLLLQLNQLDADDIIVILARRMVSEFFEQLIHHDYAPITKALFVPAQQCQSALTLIQSLDPKPGYQISPIVPELIIPDLILTEDQGLWRVEICENTLPPIRLQQQYALSTSESLRGYLQEAKLILHALKLRMQSLLLIGKAIMLKQYNFIEKGVDGLIPLTLEDLCHLTGYHVSSLSRLTRQKYIHTPRGIFELKYFLSGGITTQTGEAMTVMAIKAIISELIAKEDHQQPLTDNAIVDLLKARGIPVARRTVAKYREVLNIPPYSQRKSMYEE
jgi:RNA polymerase sigma-54 factor